MEYGNHVNIDIHMVILENIFINVDKADFEKLQKC